MDFPIKFGGKVFVKDEEEAYVSGKPMRCEIVIVNLFNLEDGSQKKVAVLQGSHARLIFRRGDFFGVHGFQDIVLLIRRRIFCIFCKNNDQSNLKPTHASRFFFL